MAFVIAQRNDITIINIATSEIFEFINKISIG
jgi:hypothetical protein